MFFAWPPNSSARARMIRRARWPSWNAAGCPYSCRRYLSTNTVMPIELSQVAMPMPPCRHESL